jgi:hypothetical protein
MCSAWLSEKKTVHFALYAFSRFVLIVEVDGAMNS